MLRSAGVGGKHLKTLLRKDAPGARHSSIHNGETVPEDYPLPEPQRIFEQKPGNNTSVELITEGLNTLQKSPSYNVNPILKPLNNPAYSRPKRTGLGGGIILTEKPATVYE